MPRLATCVSVLPCSALRYKGLPGVGHGSVGYMELKPSLALFKPCCDALTCIIRNSSLSETIRTVNRVS